LYTPPQNRVIKCQNLVALDFMLNRLALTFVKNTMNLLVRLHYKKINISFFRVTIIDINMKTGDTHITKKN